MGKAYVELLSDTIRLLFQLQSYAATADPVIREQVRAGYGRIVGEVTRLSGATPDEVWQFFSHGHAPQRGRRAAPRGDRRRATPWAAGWCEPGELIRLSRSHGPA